MEQQPLRALADKSNWPSRTFKTLFPSLALLPLVADAGPTRCNVTVINRSVHLGQKKRPWPAFSSGTMTVIAALEEAVSTGTNQESIDSARGLFPSTEKLAYFNTAAVSLGSTILRDAYSNFIADWTENGLNAQRTDGGTALIAFSAVQSASGHRSDILSIADIASRVGAITFVDGSQMAGALPVAPYLDSIDVFATSDHKFLLNAVRGVGYCYIRESLQHRMVPTNAGWKAGAVPMESFFGPQMRLSQTASRFDNSLNWLAAIGDEAALSLFTRFGINAVFERNIALVDSLRDRLTNIGRPPISLPPANQSTIIALPLDQPGSTTLVNHLNAQGVVCRARDGNLRLSVHFYNHVDDIDRLIVALKGE